MVWSICPAAATWVSQPRWHRSSVWMCWHFESSTPCSARSPRCSACGSPSTTLVARQGWWRACWLQPGRLWSCGRPRCCATRWVASPWSSCGGRWPRTLARVGPRSAAPPSSSWRSCSLPVCDPISRPPLWLAPSRGRYIPRCVG